MIARLFYFPIDGNNVMIDTLSNYCNDLTGFSPLCVKSVVIPDKRRLSYVDLANKYIKIMIRNGLNNTQTTMTQIFTKFYEDSKDNSKVADLFFTFNSENVTLNVCGERVLIKSGCLSELNMDRQTISIIEAELERMLINYGSLS